MNRLPIHVMVLLLLTCFAGTAWSKGAITRIVIDGGGLPESIQITDPEVLDKFTIWSGPGVGGWDMATTVAPLGTPKFIVDWTKGIVDYRPSTTNPYLIRMFIEGREAPNDTYEVLYEVDPNSGLAYVYLPSPSRDSFGLSNMYQIARGVEGNWFRSTHEWNKVIVSVLRGR